MIDPVINKAPLFRARFLQKVLLANDKSIDPDWVYKAFEGLKGAKGALARAHFIEVLYKKGQSIAGKKITPESIYKEYGNLPKYMEQYGSLLRFKQDVCLAGLKFDGNKIEPGAVLKELQELHF